MTIDQKVAAAKLALLTALEACQKVANDESYDPLGGDSTFMGVIAEEIVELLK